MNAAQCRHYAAIQQLARDEWPADDQQVRTYSSDSSEDVNQ